MIAEANRSTAPVDNPGIRTVTMRSIVDWVNFVGNRSPVIQAIVSTGFSFADFIDEVARLFTIPS